MVLLALPYPPLPCVVGRVEGMELTGEEQVKTSYEWIGMGVTCVFQVVTTHTLYAKCLEDARLRGSEGSHAERRRRQTDVFQRFLHAMATKGFDAEGEGLYAMYCEFGREHLGTYFEGDGFEASVSAWC